MSTVVLEQLTAGCICEIPPGTFKLCLWITVCLSWEDSAVTTGRWGRSVLGADYIFIVRYWSTDRQSLLTLGSVRVTIHSRLKAHLLAFILAFRWNFSPLPKGGKDRMKWTLLFRVVNWLEGWKLKGHGHKVYRRDFSIQHGAGSDRTMKTRVVYFTSHRLMPRCIYYWWLCGKFSPTAAACLSVEVKESLESGYSKYSACLRCLFCCWDGIHSNKVIRWPRKGGVCGRV